MAVPEYGLPQMPARALAGAVVSSSVIVGFSGSGYAYLPADPLVTGVTASPVSGVEVPGDIVTLTLTMSEAVTVTGTPTLSLNDGGTASYTGGSGTNAAVQSAQCVRFHLAGQGRRATGER